jgi:hypothetical protein
VNFKGWLELQEVGTSTGDVAGFQRQIMPIIRRANLGPWGSDYKDPFFEKKKKKRLNSKMDENSSTPLHVWDLTYHELRSILEGDDLARRHNLLGELFPEYVRLAKPDKNNDYCVNIWGEFHQPDRFGRARLYFNDLSARHRNLIRYANDHGYTIRPEVQSELKA